MGKTQKQYYDEIYDEGKQSLDKVYSQKKKTDAQALTEINQGIDQATSAAVGQYEQRIAAAPKESRVQFDQNAVRDAVAKKQVQERLANMGVTDSGLNSSMQTALAIQKQRADNTVRADEAAKIQAYREAIDKIVADGEIQKGNHQATVKKDTADWYAAALAELENNSQKSAAEAYAADQDYDAKVYAADQDYNARVYEADAKSAQQRQQDAQDIYNRFVDEAGDDPVTAQAKVNALYPSQDTATNLFYEAIRNGYSDKEAQIYASAGGGEKGEDAVANNALETAQQFVNGLNLRVTKGWDTFWGRSDSGDGQALAEHVENITKDNKQFINMSRAEQNAVLTLAVATALANDTYWTNHDKNYKRMKKACNVLGIDYTAVEEEYKGLNGIKE